MTQKEEDKRILAQNLKRYMEQAGKSRTDLAEALGISYFTITDWVKGKKLPRMDKLQALADYFGVTRADLIEEFAEPEDQARLEAKILKDADLMEMIKKYYSLSESNKKAVRQLVDTLSAAD